MQRKELPFSILIICFVYIVGGVSSIANFISDGSGSLVVGILLMALGGCIFSRYGWSLWVLKAIAVMQGIGLVLMMLLSIFSTTTAAHAVIFGAKFEVSFLVGSIFVALLVGVHIHAAFSKQANECFENA